MFVSLLKQFKITEIEFDALLLLCQETIDCIIKMNHVLIALKIIMNIYKCSLITYMINMSWLIILNLQGNHIMIPLV